MFGDSESREHGEELRRMPIGSIQSGLEKLTEKQKFVVGIMALADDVDVAIGTFNRVKSKFSSIRYTIVEAALYAVGSDYNQLVSYIKFTREFGLPESTGVILAFSQYPNETLARAKTDDRRGPDFYQRNIATLLSNMEFCKVLGTVQ